MRGHCLVTLVVLWEGTMSQDVGLRDGREIPPETLHLLMVVNLAGSSEHGPRDMVRLICRIIGKYHRVMRLPALAAKPCREGRRLDQPLSLIT